MQTRDHLSRRLGHASLALACVGVAAGFASAHVGSASIAAVDSPPRDQDAALLIALREDQPAGGVVAVSRGVKRDGRVSVTAKPFTTTSGREAILVTIAGRPQAGGCGNAAAVRLCVAAFQPAGLVLAGKADPAVSRVVVVDRVGQSLESPIVNGLWLIHVPMAGPGRIADVYALDASGARTATAQTRSGLAFVNRLGGELASMGREAARRRR